MKLYNKMNSFKTANSFIMRFKAALCYQNSIAFYNVYLLNVNTYKAKLEECSGQAQPPTLVNLQKNTLGWNSDCLDNEIVNELGAAIDFKKFSVES